MEPEELMPETWRNFAGVSLGQAKTAWERRDRIIGQRAQQKDPAETAKKTKVPKAAVEWIFSTFPLEDVLTGENPYNNDTDLTVEKPQAVSASPVTGTGAENKQTAPEQESQQVRPPNPSQNTQQPATESPGPVQMPPQGSMSGWDGSSQANFKSSGMAGEFPFVPNSSPVTGQFDIPDIYRNLMSIMMDWGITEPKARGVVRTFRYYDPSDLSKLRQLLKDAGANPQIIRCVMEAWSLAVKDEGVADKTIPKVTLSREERMSKLKKGLVEEDGEEADDELTKAERKKEALELKKIEVELELKEEELKKAKEARTPAKATETASVEATPADPLDELVPIVVDYGYGPIEKKVKMRSIHLYEAYRPKKTAPEGENEAVRALKEQNTMLLQKLEDEKKDRALDERFKRLEDMIGQIAGGGGNSEQKAEIKELRDALHQQQVTELQNTNKALVERVDKLGETFQKMRDPEFIELKKQNLKREAKAYGIVSSEEAEQLNEQNIALEERHNAAKRKDEAQGGLIAVVTEKAKSTGKGRDIAIESVKEFVPLGKEFIKQAMNPNQVGTGIPLGPTPSDIALAEQHINQEMQMQAIANQQGPPTALPEAGEGTNTVPSQNQNQKPRTD